MKGLKYISWNDTSGYATAAFRYIKGLQEAGVPLTWTPMVPGSGWGQEFGYEPLVGHKVEGSELSPLCNQQIDYDTVLIHLVPEYFPRWLELEAGRRVIGYTTWETDRIPNHWPNILNRLDRVWVPSSWNKEVFKRSGVTVPIDVIPHILGAAPSKNPEAAHPLTSHIPDDHFVFYSVNVWSRRKALWLLLEAYWSTFEAHEPVVLVLKTSRNDGTSRFRHRRFPLAELSRTSITYRRLAKRFRTRPPTVLIAEENTPQPAIDELHRRGDCYASLSRSEGWGLGAFDAVAAGNPIVMTGFGGQTDFLDREHAYFVDYELIPVDDAMNSRSYSPDQHWADPCLRQAGQLLRTVYENQEEAQKNARCLQVSARDRFSEKVVVRMMMDIL